MATIDDLVNRAVDIALTKEHIHKGDPEVMEFLGSVGIRSYQNWCAAFVYFCFEQAAKELDMPNPAVKSGGVAFHWANAMGSHGKIPTLRGKNVSPASIRRGQVFVFFNSVECKTGHIGFVVGPKDDGSFETVEGNANPAGATDGGGVYRRTRDYAQIASQWGGIIDFAGLANHTEAARPSPAEQGDSPEQRHAPAESSPSSAAPAVAGPSTHDNGATGPRYFLRVATPVAKNDCMSVLKNAWTALVGAPPKDDAVRLMCAHWGVESGWGRTGYCYNLANMRTPSKYDYTYISGNEKIDGHWVYFDKDHPSKMSRFRAFHTPQEAANAYVDLLSRLHKGAFSVLQGSCDATDFSRALSKQHGTGYYTDDFDHYTRGLVGCHDMVKNLPVPEAGPVTGYPVLAPDPRGDPSTWPGDHVAGTSPPASTPAPVSAPSPVAAPESAPQVAAPESTPQVTAPESRSGEARRGARQWITRIPEVTGQGSPEIREAAFWEEFQKGNYPSFVTTFAPVVLTDKEGRRATLQVSVDFVAIGTDDDWLRFPLSGYMASRVAATFGCFLPTNKLVLETYRQAAIKLVAHPFDCQGSFQGRWQRSNLATVAHEDLLQGILPCKEGQRIPSIEGKLDPKMGKHKGACSVAGPHPGVLVSGHMKEVIVSHEDLTRRLAFWGLWSSSGTPIQATFGCPHGPGYSDYSHGVRLVKADVDLDGKAMSYVELITSPAYAGLMFEGGAACPKAAYPNPPAHYFMGF